MKISRRSIVSFAVAAAVMAGGTITASAQEKVLRIGYQKYGNVILLKNKGSLEGKLSALGYKVTWAEFPSGPPLLEALNAGAIDFGHAGEAPPIFAQAAAANFVYIAHEPPAPKGEAILVPKGSGIKSVAELKGKRVALNKGSNVHYLLVQALEKAGVKYSEIETVFLSPSDARAAFESGKVDAWVIWDPFQASAEAGTGARVLVDAEGLASNHQFYFGTRSFAEANAKAIETVVAELKIIGDEVKAEPKKAAEALSPSIGIPADVLEVALRRQAFGIKPIDDAVIAEQQKVADRFVALGVLPKPIKVNDAIWRVGS